jgi:hypothetical protein
MVEECPENNICFTEQQWSDFLVEYELDIVNEVGSMPESMGDAEAATQFAWELLFLSPWELAYIALPMSVLAFYGLSIYAIFKRIQKKWS